MSFGKRSDRTASRRRKARPESAADEQGPEVVDDLALEFNAKAVSLVFVLALFGAIVLAGPYSYAPQKARYTNTQMGASKIAAGMPVSERKAVVERLGIDFSQILTPAYREPTEAMKAVSRKCFQNQKLKSVVMPTDNVHSVFRTATRYLTCAMKTDIGRLCDTGERKRLASQLKVYSDRRQNMVALEKALQEAADKRMAAYKAQKAQGYNVTAPDISVPSIGETFDPKIKAHLSRLVRGGYLSATDFGWIGLLVPRDYAEQLSQPAVAQPAC